ncbi:ATP-binding protein [Candidatus Pacearchaeota archaeon]|nr:ATP-binding protein [Candidatus Pacearchaeota archaeon]
MFQRLSQLSKDNSFFLFGPRGTGKSTLLEQFFNKNEVFWVDLLDANNEADYLLRPEKLLERWQSITPNPKWIVIDEVQKVPKLLDIAHLGIEQYKINFALTGSSARKLKRGGANLLAGRAFVFNLYPLTFVELGKAFNIKNILEWGSLPKIIKYESSRDKKRYLNAYTHTYLKEEIQVEQAVRKIEPFRRFLEVAAQMNGMILNFSKLGREATVEEKSVERYFEVLNDTQLGFYLPAFHRSIRKQQIQKPKFYFFDLGVVRAIRHHLDLPLREGTYEYGRVFEHFVISECIRLNDYFEKDYRFYYLITKDGAEIDLIVERPTGPLVLIEIKSAQKVDERDFSHLTQLSKAFKNPECFVFSREKLPRKVGKVEIIFWENGIKKLFNINM